MNSNDSPVSLNFIRSFARFVGRQFISCRNYNLQLKLINKGSFNV